MASVVLGPPVTRRACGKAEFLGPLHLTAPLYEVPIFGDSLFGKEDQNTGGNIPFIISLIVFDFPANRSLKGYPLGATGYGRAGRQ